MTIRRDYTRSFYARRRPDYSRTLFAVIVGLLMGGLLMVVALRYDQLQYSILDSIGIAPTSTPFSSTLAQQGAQMKQEGRMTEALSMFERAVQQQPDNLNYLYEYSLLLMEEDRYDEALAVANHAVDVAPGDVRSYELRGRALMWSDPATAIQATILGQDLNPGYAPLYAIQGVAYTRLGRWQEGLRQSARALELDDTDPFVLRSLFTPYVYVGNFGGAIDALQRVISINPNHTAPYFELAALYNLRQVNEPEMAVALYNRVLEIDPNNARAYLRLCQTYANVENARFDIAQPYCDAAIAIDPFYGDAYKELGRMQYLRRNYEGSIESFETCVAFGSTEIECWSLRGIAHFWLGECDRAWEVLQEARIRGLDQGADITQIEITLGNIVELCPGYQNRAVPTPVPPTPIPPTPIGGFG